ncbi:hypothetical protein GQ54DRAFT_313057, partial [Martensiomyces pterosporus]
NALGINVPNGGSELQDSEGSPQETEDSEESSFSDDESAAQPIETTAQFLEWYSKVESQLAEGQDQEAHKFAELLRTRATQCSSMVQCVAEVESLLNRMEANYHTVCEQTEGVKAACSELQVRRDKLVKMSHEISGQLAVYNSLSQIAQLFNSPGDHVCLDREFLPSLERAERAIGFIEEHPGGQDSELYLMRFSQCRMRALTLIKMHALKVFKSLSAEISGEFAQGESSSRSAALYVRFRAAAVSLSPLLHALHMRAKEVGSTEKQVMLDVQNAYFQARRAWLRPYIQDSLKSITKEQEEMAAAEAGDNAALATAATSDVRVGSLRDWCAFVMNVCADEYRLYYDFFDAQLDLPQNSQETGESSGDVALSVELRGYLDSVMTIFHEQVRPLIIHESDVAVLGGLSMTLLTYHRPSPAYVADNADIQPPRDEMAADAEASRDSKSFVIEENGLDAFYSVVDQILQDAQQRLAYKSQSYVRSHITGFKVAKADSEAMARWISLCSQLQITSPEDLEVIAAHASVAVDLQDSPAPGSDAPSISRASSSFVDVTTTAATAVESETSGNAKPDMLSGQMKPNPAISRLLERIPGGSLSAEQTETLGWIYPPVRNYRWLVSQIDGCLDYEVQSDVVEEAQAACKQNLLNQGARFVRDLTIKAGNSREKRSLAEADAEHLAHLFVTYNLSRIEHTF